MKLTRKKSCLIIYALFFAIFKPYFLPTNMQQGIKILIIMWCLFLIAIKMKPIRWINISLLYSGIIAISSYIAYKNNYVSQSTLLDGIFYSICIYVVYTIFEYLCKKENIEYIMACILDVSGLYAVLTILSLFKPLYIDDSGLSVYLFGNKFLSSYYLLFFLMTFYSVYNIKIKNNYTWRIRFLFLALICLLFTVGAKCSTGAIATILIIISLFVPDKIKRVLKSPWIVMGSMVASALFPTFMTVIMNNIRHNICKANRIQNGTYQIEEEKYKQSFEKLDLMKILENQTSASRDEQNGFIWVLSTCVFVVPEYNFSLVTE